MTRLEWLIDRGVEIKRMITSWEIILPYAESIPAWSVGLQTHMPYPGDDRGVRLIAGQFEMDAAVDPETGVPL